MRAIVFDDFGGPDVLRVDEVDEPHPERGEVRVRVRAVGVNPLDWKIRSGHAPFPVELPYVGGLEVAGIVDEVGAGVGRVSVGDEIFGLTERGLAAHAILTSYATKPAGLSWAQAAALPISISTAMRALNDLDVQEHETLLVHGASGGVGSVAAQLARAIRTTVIGTAGERNLAFVESLGAAAVAHGGSMVTHVRQLAPDGVDKALDCVGRGALAELVDLTGASESVVTIADPAAADHGVRFSVGEPNPRPYGFSRIANLVADGEFIVRVGPTFSFDEVGEAQRLSEAGGYDGKIVVLVDDDAG